MAETTQSPASAPVSFLDNPPVVIGAGPTGSLVASLLSAQNIPVILLERRHDLSSYDLAKSYFMTLEARGKGALSRVPELLQSIASKSCPGKGFHIKVVNKNGALKTVLKLPSPAGDDTADYMVMRPTLTECLATHVKSLDGVDAHFGVTTEALQFLDDGKVQVKYTTADREKKVIHTKCVIACDGKNSFVAKQIDQGAQERPEAYVMSNGTGDIQCFSAAHDVGVKSVVLDANYVEGLIGEQSSGDALPPFDLIRIPGSKNEHMKTPFNLVLFPNPPSVIPKIGGYLASIPILPEHPIGEVDNVDRAYELFQATFPALDIRKIISESSMHQFVSSRTPVFGQPRRRASLTCYSSDGNAGVVFLGDAAHSFPPDVGLGVNAALEDAIIFVDSIKASSSSCSVGDVMRSYEKEREEEITALVQLHGKAMSQYQYRRNLMGTLAIMNSLLRKFLSSLLPGVFWPTCGILVRQERKYSEALRKADLTTQRLTIMATAIAVGIMAVVLAR